MMYHAYIVQLMKEIKDLFIYCETKTSSLW
jgi:hypothetical protein